MPGEGADPMEAYIQAQMSLPAEQRGKADTAATTATPDSTRTEITTPNEGGYGEDYITTMMGLPKETREQVQRGKLTIDEVRAQEAQRKNSEAWIKLPAEQVANALQTTTVEQTASILRQLPQGRAGELLKFVPAAKMGEVSLLLRNPVWEADQSVALPIPEANKVITAPTIDTIKNELASVGTPEATRLGSNLRRIDSALQSEILDTRASARKRIREIDSLPYDDASNKIRRNEMPALEKQEALDLNPTIDAIFARLMTTPLSTDETDLIQRQKDNAVTMQEQAANQQQEQERAAAEQPKNRVKLLEIAKTEPDKLMRAMGTHIINTPAVSQEDAIALASNAIDRAVSESTLTVDQRRKLKGQLQVAMTDSFDIDALKQAIKRKAGLGSNAEKEGDIVRGIISEYQRENGEVETPEEQEMDLFAFSDEDEDPLAGASIVAHDTTAQQTPAESAPVPLVWENQEHPGLYPELRTPDRVSRHDPNIRVVGGRSTDSLGPLDTDSPFRLTEFPWLPSPFAPLTDSARDIRQTADVLRNGHNGTNGDTNGEVTTASLDALKRTLEARNPHSSSGRKRR